MATKAAFNDATGLDIVVIGSITMVSHLLTAAGVNFKMAVIDQLSRHVPRLYKLHQLHKNIIWKIGSPHSELEKYDE